MKIHEAGCWRNPEVRACLSCKHGRHIPPNDEGPPYWECHHPNEGANIGLYQYGELLDDFNKPVCHCKWHEARK